MKSSVPILKSTHTKGEGQGLYNQPTLLKIFSFPTSLFSILFLEEGKNTVICLELEISYFYS